MSEALIEKLRHRPLWANDLDKKLSDRVVVDLRALAADA